MEAQRPHTWHTVLPPPTAIGTLADILRDSGMLLLLLLLDLATAAGSAAAGLVSICMSGGSCAVLSPPLLKKENQPRLFFRGGCPLALTGATSGNFMRGGCAAKPPPPPASKSSSCVCPGSCRGGGGCIYDAAARVGWGGGASRGPRRVRDQRPQAQRWLPMVIWSSCCPYWVGAATDCAAACSAAFKLNIKALNTGERYRCRCA